MPGAAIRYTSDPVKIRAGSVFVTKSETYQSHFPCVKQASDKSRHLKPSHGHAPMLLTSLHGFPVSYIRSNCADYSLTDK